MTFVILPHLMCSKSTTSLNIHKSDYRFVTLLGLLQDRDSAVAKQRELEMEIKVLRDRCDSASNAMMATRRELEEKEMRFSKYENESRSAATAVRSMELATKGFREQLASLLSIEGHMPIQPVDEAIRDRVKAVVMALRDKSTVSLNEM